MLIGVMSDSHNDKDHFLEAVKVFKQENVSHVYHAGDLTSPEILNAIKEIHCTFDAVFGNCDIQRTEFQKINGGRFNFHYGSLEFTLEGKYFLMTHNPEDIQTYSHNRHFDCIIFGHTHFHEIKTYRQTLYLNPGEVAAYRSGKATIALLEVPSLKVKMIKLS